MENLCWTQKRLAVRMCVSPDEVSSWVRGVNHPTLETVKELCEIFYIPIQELTNDAIDIPEYYELEPWEAYIDYGDLRRPGDSIHTIIDAGLAYEGMLHRFTNEGGAECSAIYRGNMEMWRHSIRSILKMTGRVPSLQQVIIMRSSLVQPFMMEASSYQSQVFS